MKYAITYNRNFKYLDVVDEVILYWSTKDDIVDFVKEKFPNQDQRITISVNAIDEFNFDMIYAAAVELKKVHNNMSLRFEANDMDTKELIKLKDSGIRYYFEQQCSSLDKLYGLTMLGASDVIITEELAFDLPQVSAYCKSRGIKIRVFPNVAQNNGYGLATVIPDIKKFFIRPEDVEIYEKYVDIFEIWGAPEKTSVLYEIYKQQQWLGSLKDIITGFTEDVPNTGFMKHFALCRLNCGKKCFKGVKCDMCNLMKNISKEMTEDGFMLQTEKKPIISNDTTIEKIMPTARNDFDEVSEEGIEE